MLGKPAMGLVLVGLLILGCTRDNESQQPPSGGAHDAAADAAVGSDASTTGGDTATCNTPPSGGQISVSGVSPGPPTNLADAIHRGNVVAIGAVAGGMLANGAVIRTLSGLRYCANYVIGTMQVSERVVGDIPDAAGVGYLSGCGPTLDATGAGVECDLPDAPATFIDGSAAAFILSGPSPRADMDAGFWSIGWSFPVVNGQVMLDSIDGGSESLQHFTSDVTAMH